MNVVTDAHAAVAPHYFVKPSHNTSRPISFLRRECSKPIIERGTAHAKKPKTGLKAKVSSSLCDKHFVVNSVSARIFSTGDNRLQLKAYCACEIVRVLFLKEGKV